MLKRLKKGEKLLGVEFGKRRYDLPLDKTEGTGFLKVLILMMTILAVMALAVFFVLSDMADRWASGLENKATVEIPAHNVNGDPVEPERITQFAQSSALILKNNPDVETATIMGKDDIQNLVSPWFGDNMNLNDIPLPGLISVSFKDGSKPDIKTLERELHSISSLIRIDTHKSWLVDVLRITGSLKFGSAILLIVIGLITVSAVAGAVKSRVAVHKDEVELLHLIGATDQYITNQFQKHTAFMTLQSAAIGLIIGLIALFIIGKIAGNMDLALLPDFSIGTGQYLSFLALPALMSGLGMLTARITVLHALRRMP